VAAASFKIDVGAYGRVSGAIYRAASPIQATLILAHGAGAPRTHPFMVDMATRLAKKGLDVVTFNFLYAEEERRMPDRIELLEATWRAAIATVRARGGLRPERLFIGGKSMGGRIATHIAAANEGLVIAGVVLLGYPLHPLGKPRLVRKEILEVSLPMIVVQGTRDQLGTAAEVKRLLARRERTQTRLHVVEGGDHSLVIPKKEGREEQERVLDEAASAIALFVQSPNAKSKRKTTGRARAAKPKSKK